MFSDMLVFKNYISNWFSQISKVQSAYQSIVVLVSSWCEKGSTPHLLGLHTYAVDYN